YGPTRALVAEVLSRVAVKCWRAAATALFAAGFCTADFAAGDFSIGFSAGAGATAIAADGFTSCGCAAVGTASTVGSGGEVNLISSALIGAGVSGSAVVGAAGGDVSSAAIAAAAGTGVS